MRRMLAVLCLLGVSVMAARPASSKSNANAPYCHSGAVDPKTEGWIPAPTHATINVLTAMGIYNATGIPLNAPDFPNDSDVTVGATTDGQAWFINDQAKGNANNVNEFGAYIKYVLPPDQLQAKTKGWTLSFEANIEQASTTPDDMVVFFSNGMENLVYSVWLGQDASGDLLVQCGLGNGQFTTKPIAATASGYHTFSIDYAPPTATVTVDGTSVGTFHGDAGTILSGFLAFGTASSNKTGKLSMKSLTFAPK